MATAPWAPIHIPQTYRPASSRWPHLLQTWLPVFFFLGIFAGESTAALGANHTSAPLHTLLHALFGNAIDPRWSQIHHMLRKIGHLAGYGLFSVAAFRCIHRSLGQRRNPSLAPAAQKRAAQSLAVSTSMSHALAVAAAFVIATADEIHQTFLPNRTGCFADVLIDTAGAVAFQAVLFLVLRLAASRSRAAGRSHQLTSHLDLPLAA